MPSDHEILPADRSTVVGSCGSICVVNAIVNGPEHVDVWLFAEVGVQRAYDSYTVVIRGNFTNGTGLRLKMLPLPMTSDDPLAPQEVDYTAQHSTAFGVAKSIQNGSVSLCPVRRGTEYTAPFVGCLLENDACKVTILFDCSVWVATEGESPPLTTLQQLRRAQHNRIIRAWKQQCKQKTSLAHLLEKIMYGHDRADHMC